MRKIFLMSSVLFVAPFTAGNAAAQCITATDCASLGYDMPSCSDGKGIKCPYGNKYACPICASSYRYSCTGSYQSPQGTPCKNKYESCNCSDNRTWTNGSCTCNSNYKYTCTGTNQTKPSSSLSCGGKYAACGCVSPYTWVNGQCLDMRTACDKGCKNGNTLLAWRSQTGLLSYGCSPKTGANYIETVGQIININNSCIVIDKLRYYDAMSLSNTQYVKNDMMNRFPNLNAIWSFDVKKIQNELKANSQYTDLEFFYNENEFYNKQQTASCYKPATSEDKKCSDAAVLLYAKF